MFITKRPLLLLALLATASLTSLGAPAVRADQAATAPEQRALDLINQARVAEGKAALRWDSRLADIAQWRSDYQVEHGFGHLSSWDPILSRMDAKGIIYDAYGEVLVLGTPRDPMDSAREAVETWRSSPSHWAWLSSTQFNYIALGVARDANGWYYWTGLLIHIPGAPPPAQTSPPAPSIAASQPGSEVDGRRHVMISWSGENASLFRLQKRIGAGDWRAVTDWTTATARSMDLRVGRTYSFRVRSRDAAGNRSAWSEVVHLSL